MPVREQSGDLSNRWHHQPCLKMLSKLEKSAIFYFHYYLHILKGKKKGFPIGEHKLIGNMCWTVTNNTVEIQYGSWKGSIAYITSFLVIFKNLLRIISKQLRLQ